MAEGAIISSALKNTHLAFYDLLAKQRLTEIDLSIILVSMIDTADIRLLTLLAGQLDMLGYNGWVLAETDDQRRALLKSAVDLHRMKGTPGGIQEVLKRLGFVGARIEEGWENFTDGSTDPGGNSWAYFRVVYNPAPDKEINADLAAKLFGLIEAYKPARSKMANFAFGLPQLDRVSAKGIVNMQVIDVATGNIINNNTYVNKLYFASFFNMIRSVAALSEATSSAALNDFGYRINKISFGTANTPNDPAVLAPPPTIANPTTKLLDVDPNNPSIGVKYNYGGSAPAPYPGFTLTHFFSLGASEGNGKTFREMALVLTDFRADGEQGPDVVLSRITRGSVVKTSAIRIEGTWTLIWDINV